MTLVTQAARANVPVIAITGSGFSPLARDAKIWFKVTEANFEGFRSLASNARHDDGGGGEARKLIAFTPTHLVLRPR